ncbi:MULTISPECIES: hypothetical protein [Pseudomonas]|nr:MULTISPECIES: hypothetical protein [Pseudomonas]ERT19784.2 hypothetical protein O162_03690 [Pseudomonas putida SJ3]MBP2084312.1 hypothetical protein [Pseudomonas sp. PvP089]MBP2089987.1 hypothetical protein [Pseudomonas sp. PvP088]MBP2223850.1 hypothetical protein [Pseudomonas putida]MCE0782300.1 hypothetical protein [Pseudomonas sp. NMI542_15]
MKSLMCMCPLLFSFLVSGCTASDWVEVAGGVMQGRDDYNKAQRTARLKRANKAAMRMKRSHFVE